MYSLSADGTTAAISFSPWQLSPPPGNTRIAIYRVPDGSLLNMFELADMTSSGVDPYDLALSPDGTLLCLTEVGNGLDVKVRMLDTATGTTLWTGNDRQNYPLWSPDGSTLFTVKNLLTATPPTLEAVDARTGALKWSTGLNGDSPQNLALVGDGALLTAIVFAPTNAPCPNPGDCPPVFQFWSSADGTAAMQLPAVPQTSLYGTLPNGYANFTCTAGDTCAVGFNAWNGLEQSNFIHVYKTDGTVLRDLATPTGKAIEDMAISPNGKFITIANPYDLDGGATVYSIDDGTVVGSRIFSTDTF
jgi:Tol biopolymer transport system component